MPQPTTPPDSRNRDGDIAIPTEFGRYRIDNILGRGAMGTVYLAFDKELNRRVALKIPKIADSAPVNLIDRFRREARSAAALSHPNICPIHDVGEFEGRHYICMGYVEGRPLSDLVTPGNLLSEGQVALLIRLLARALHEAHERGIVHRDLKPSNIMINQRGEPIIMDFGLSRHVDDNASRLTADGTVVGTPAYMAPEQLNDKPGLGPAIDIYSLGVVMYELLTGKAPFTGSVIAVISQVLHAEPAALEQLRPDISPEMAAICRRAMAKDPAQRFQSMTEFEEALEQFKPDDATTALRGVKSTMNLARSASATKQDLTVTREPAETIVFGSSTTATPATPARKKAGWRMLAGIVAASVVVIGGGLFAMRFVFPPVDQPPGDPATMSANAPAGKRPRPPDGVPPMFPPEDLAPDQFFGYFDQNGDQTIDPEELALHVVHRADTDANDLLTRDEYQRAFERLGEGLFAPPDRPGYGPRHRKAGGAP